MENGVEKPSLHNWGNVSPFRMNTYEKHTGWGWVLLLTRNRLSSLPGSPDLADSRNLLCQFANFLFKLPVFAAAIGKRCAQARLKLALSLSPRKFRDIDAADSCSGHNDDPFPCGFDKFGERRGSF